MLTARNGAHLSGCAPCRFHAGSLTAGHNIQGGGGFIGGTPDFGGGGDIASITGSSSFDLPTFISGAAGTVDAVTKEGDVDVPQLITGVGTFIGGLFGSGESPSPMDEAQQQGADADRSVIDQIGDVFKNIFLEPQREASQTTQDRLALFASGGSQSQFLGLTPLGVATVAGVGFLLFFVLRK